MRKWLGAWRRWIFLGMAGALLSGSFARAQMLLTQPGAHYLINFDGFQGAGFKPAPDAGQLSSNTWSVLGMSDGDLLFGNTATTGDLARGATTIAVPVGGIYAYVDGVNPILYWQPTGTGDFEPGALILRLQNNTGAELHYITISYTLYCRNDQGRSNVIGLGYSQDNVIFADIPDASFASPADADALGLTSVSRAVTISQLVVPVGGLFFIKWSCTANGGLGARDEFGLDDILITPEAGSAAKGWTLYR